MNPPKSETGRTLENPRLRLRSDQQRLAEIKVDSRCAVSDRVLTLEYSWIAVRDINKIQLIEESQERKRESKEGEDCFYYLWFSQTFFVDCCSSSLTSCTSPLTLSLVLLSPTPLSVHSSLVFFCTVYCILCTWNTERDTY